MDETMYYKGLLDAYIQIRKFRVFILSFLFGLVILLFYVTRPINIKDFKEKNPIYIIAYLYMHFRTILRFSFYGYILHLFLVIVVFFFLFRLYTGIMLSYIFL